MGLGEGLAELGVGTCTQLSGDGLRLDEGGSSRIGVARQLLDSSLLAQELAELQLVNATKQCTSVPSSSEPGGCSMYCGAGGLDKKIDGCGNEAWIGGDPSI